MTYRLYTEDVRNGLTDFNDDHYHILEYKIIDSTTIAVVYDERRYIVTYGLQYEVLNSICWTQGHYYDDLTAAMRKYESYDEQPQEQIVVIKDTGDEILFVLKIKNYDYKFENALYETRETYEENCLETGWEDENGEQVGISFEDFVLKQIEEAGYEYEFTGFETFEV